MTAVLGQLLTRALPAAVISSMGGSNAKKWQTMLSQAAAAGYGVGEVIDFLQNPEGAKTRSTRENIERRDSQGIATSSEIANKPERPNRPGEQLKQLSLGIGGPLAALQAVTGGVGGGEPPPPSPNATPRNDTNRLNKVMSKKAKAPSIMDPVEVGKKSLQDIAPSIYQSARSLMEQGSSIESVTEKLRSSSRRDKSMAKEMRSVRAMFPGMELADVLKSQIVSSPSYDDLDTDEIALQSEIEALLNKLGA